MIKEAGFREKLFSWYCIHRRDLPWRHTIDPYRIWVSEIILQQTRVSQGTAYYLDFVCRFPDIASLAQSPEKEVLRAWQGLGYYTRARNLHAAAKQVMEQFNGTFPSTLVAIRSLKGVGDYTAAAIGSIAFGLPVPVVDGNVLRFFARYRGIREPVNTVTARNRIRELASRLIPVENPGEFNQAVMEFGALQCRPVHPVCSSCPFRNTCAAFREGLTDVLPVRIKNRQPVKRHFHYLVLIRGSGPGEETIVIKKRLPGDIWAGLYELPLIETKRPLSLEKLVQTGDWKTIFGNGRTEISGVSGRFRHFLSHRVIEATFIKVKYRGKMKFPFLEVPVSRLGEYPFPKLVLRYLSAAG